MAKKKPTGGQHATPRKPVQIPTEWFTVAQALASERKMPVLWLVIDLIRREAEAAGKKGLPAVPWEHGTRE